MTLQIFLYATYIQFALTCISVVLFSYGYPDTARMSLWEEGGAQKFNSDPRLRIYFYANHQEPPPIPYIWSQNSTDFNLGVAILAFWVCLIRLLLIWCKVRNLAAEIFLQCCVLVTWLLCFASQLARDFSDENHKSRVPWYLSHSCVATQRRAISACYVAQGAFVITILTICLDAALLSFAFVGADSNWVVFQVKKNFQTTLRYHIGVEYNMVDSDEGEMLEM